VNYFTHLGVEYHYLKIGCSEFNFAQRCWCNLPFFFNCDVDLVDPR
jgi:hypothetical protein